jgi:hypothetical protein
MESESRRLTRKSRNAAAPQRRPLPRRLLSRRLLSPPGPRYAAASAVLAREHPRAGQMPARTVRTGAPGWQVVLPVAAHWQCTRAPGRAGPGNARRFPLAFPTPARHDSRAPILAPSSTPEPPCGVQDSDPQAASGLAVPARGRSPGRCRHLDDASARRPARAAQSPSKLQSKPVGLSR